MRFLNGTRVPRKHGIPVMMSGSLTIICSAMIPLSYPLINAGCRRQDVQRAQFFCCAYFCPLITTTYPPPPSKPLPARVNLKAERPTCVCSLARTPAFSESGRDSFAAKLDRSHQLAAGATKTRNREVSKAVVRCLGPRLIHIAIQAAQPANFSCTKCTKTHKGKTPDSPDSST